MKSLSVGSLFLSRAQWTAISCPLFSALWLLWLWPSQSSLFTIWGCETCYLAVKYNSCNYESPSKLILLFSVRLFCKNLVLPPEVQQDRSGCLHEAQRLKAASLCYPWGWGQCPPGRYEDVISVTWHTRTSCETSPCFIIMLFKLWGNLAQLWTKHYCFHHKTESDSRVRQLVIHYKNMEAYHKKTTKKMQAYHWQQRKLEKRNNISVFMYSVTWFWS